MPTICVAAGCSNQKDEAKGISLHVIPFFEDDRPEAKRRRKKWVDFVKQKRAKWSHRSARWYALFISNLRILNGDLPSVSKGGNRCHGGFVRTTLVVVFPIIHTVGKEDAIGEPSKREKRMVSHWLHNTFQFFVFWFSSLPYWQHLCFRRLLKQQWQLKRLLAQISHRENPWLKERNPLEWLRHPPLFSLQWHALKNITLSNRPFF